MTKREQKFQDILIGLLMTWVEDQFVKIEHLDERGGRANPPTCTFAEQSLKMLEGEATNCGYNLSKEDKLYFLKNLSRVSLLVRT